MARKRKKNGGRVRRGRRANRNRTGQNGRQSTGIPKSLGIERYAGSRFGGRGGFPPSLRLRSTWSVYTSVAAAAAVSTSYVYGNSVFKPGQPSGFGTNSVFDYTSLATIYNYWRVYASTITVKVGYSSTNVTPTATLVGGDIVLAYGTSTPTTGGMQSAMIQPGAQYRRVNAGNSYTIKMRATTKYVMGNDPSVDENLQGSAAVYPADFWYWNIFTISDAAYTGVFLNIDIKVTYDVEFFNITQNVIAFESDPGRFRKTMLCDTSESKGEIKSVPSLTPRPESPMRGERAKDATGRPTPRHCGKAMQSVLYPMTNSKGVILFNAPKWFCVEKGCSQSLPVATPSDIKQLMFTSGDSVHSPQIQETKVFKELKAASEGKEYVEDPDGDSVARWYPDVDKGWVRVPELSRDTNDGPLVRRSA